MQKCQKRSLGMARISIQSRVKTQLMVIETSNTAQNDFLVVPCLIKLGNMQKYQKIFLQGGLYCELLRNIAKNDPLWDIFDPKGL